MMKKRPTRKSPPRRDVEPSGYDVIRYASGLSYVAPAHGRPDFTSRRAAVHAAEQANAEWKRRGEALLLPRRRRSVQTQSRRNIDETRLGRPHKQSVCRQSSCSRVQVRTFS